MFTARSQPMNEIASDRVFLDAAYAIALLNIDDALHDVAISLAQHIEKHRTALVTTRPVLLEIGVNDTPR